MKDRSLRMRGVASYGLAWGLVSAGVLGGAHGRMVEIVDFFRIARD